MLFNQTIKIPSDADVRTVKQRLKTLALQDLGMLFRENMSAAAESLPLLRRAGRLRVVTAAAAALYSVLTSERRGSCAAAERPLVFSSVSRSGATRLFPAVPKTGAVYTGCPRGSGDSRAQQSWSWRCHRLAEVAAPAYTSGVTYNCI